MTCVSFVFLATAAIFGVQSASSSSSYRYRKRSDGCMPFFSQLSFSRAHTQPNGAGKTTIVRMLSTQTPADAGTAIVMGHDLRREAAPVRGVIGVTGQFSAVDDRLTGEGN